MADRWMIGPRMGHPGARDRPRARGESAICWSRILVHTTMTAVVLSVTAVVLLMTGLASIVSVDALQEMLADYPGTVIVVSHDRDFFDRVATSVLMAEGKGRFLATLDVVDMRVGAIADNEVGLLDHALGDVAVQIEGHDDAGCRAGDLARERHHLAVGVVAIGGDHGAMVGDVDGVAAQRLVPDAVAREGPLVLVAQAAVEKEGRRLGCGR